MNLRIITFSSIFIAFYSKCSYQAHQRKLQIIDYQLFAISFSCFMFTKLFTNGFQAAFREQKRVAFHPHGLLLPPRV